MAIRDRLDQNSEGRRKFLARLGSLAVYSVPACAAITGGGMREAYAAGGGEEETPQSVPEPGTLALVGLGVAAVALAARKTKKPTSDE